MTGDHLSWWQAPRAADACIEALAVQHPFLADLKPPPGLDTPDLYSWLVAAEARHGAELALTPLVDWVHQEPLLELLDQVELRQLTAEPEAPTVGPFQRATDAWRQLGASAARLSQALAALNLKGEQP